MSVDVPKVRCCGSGLCRECPAEERPAPGPLRLSGSEEFLVDRLLRNMRIRREQLLRLHAENTALEREVAESRSLIGALLRDVAVHSGRTPAEVRVYYGIEET